MKIAALQHDIAWEDAAATCTRVAPMIAAAAADGADMVLLTEMFGPGFSLAADRIAEMDAYEMRVSRMVDKAHVAVGLVDTVPRSNLLAELAGKHRLEVRALGGTSPPVMSRQY